MLVLTRAYQLVLRRACHNLCAGTDTRGRIQALHPVHDGLPLRDLPRRHGSARAGPRNRVLDRTALQHARVWKHLSGCRHHWDAVLHFLRHPAPPEEGVVAIVRWSGSDSVVVALFFFFFLFPFFGSR